MTRLGAALVVSMAAALAACGPKPDPDAEPAAASTAVVVTLGAGPAAASHDPAVRYPAGTRVVRLDGEAVTELSSGLAAAGAPCASDDGTRVLFAGRERDGESFRVYECGARGEDRRVVASAAGDCGGAAYLPAGGIVFAARTADPAPADGPGATWALFTTGSDGAAPARISWGACDVDPFVLSDGRILFSTWRPGPDGGRFLLATVHPDGTGFARFRAAAASAFRPGQTSGLDVTFREVADGTLVDRAASWDAPSESVDPPAGPVSAGGAAVLERVSLAPRPRPHGHLSSVRADQDSATLVALDARVAGNGKTLRLHVAGRPAARLALAADGSFAARVPADAPLRIEVLDTNGDVAGAEHGPIWLRPGETRVCVGCHEDPDTGPPNVRPLALQDDPADLASAAEGSR